jgi:hypothetical protein
MKITIRKASDPSNFLVARVTAATDQTTYYNLSVDFLGSSGSFFANNDPITVEFTAASQIFGPLGVVAAPGTTGITNNQLYVQEILVTEETLARGVVFWGASLGTSPVVRAGLFDSNGNRLNSTTANQAVTSTFAQRQFVPFNTAGMVIKPGRYFIALVFSQSGGSTTVQFASQVGYSATIANGSMTVPSSVTPPGTTVTVPLMALYAWT